MAKRNHSSQEPQAQHKAKTQSSQHDKRSRLGNPNPNLRKTKRAQVPLVGPLLTAICSMQAILDTRSGFRLAIIIAGMFLSRGRRTASSWFVAAGVRDDWDRFYNCLINVGKRSKDLAAVILKLVVNKLVIPGSRLMLAIDDSPTSRFGKHVEGAGVHHNPTPGPADGQWLYGHNWVALAFLSTHPLWGVIALPLRSLLYIRKVDVQKLNEKGKEDWKFRTKHVLAVDLVLWFVGIVRALGLKNEVWIVAKRAKHNGGWSSIEYFCRGSKVTRQYKTFLATSRLTGGAIRVVIVRFEDGGWAAYFCSDPNAEAKEILEAVAARWAIEEHFHDVKEIWGAGQQQVRNIWSSIGCWNLIGWMYTLVELLSWDKTKKQLTDRSDRPWDNAERRPSHADRKRTIRKEMLQEHFLAALPKRTHRGKFMRAINHLIKLAA